MKVLVFIMLVAVLCSSCKQVITREEAVACQRAGGKVVYTIDNAGNIDSAECIKN